MSHFAFQNVTKFSDKFEEGSISIGRDIRILKHLPLKSTPRERKFFLFANVKIIH